MKRAFISRLLLLKSRLNLETYFILEGVTRMEVKKYVKKPVVIEAYQTDEEVIIHTLEGDMKAMPGDYIITGINGEKYPCKPDIFHKTYDEIIDE